MHDDPEEKCRCGHERKWHDSCSRCYCQMFFNGSMSSQDGKIWKAAMKLREVKEKG